MLSFLPKVWNFIRHPTGSRTTTILLILLLFIAIPLTVVLSQQQQSLRQRAAGANLPPPISAEKCKESCLIANQTNCDWKYPITDENREEQINACIPLQACIVNGCPQVEFYSSAILEAKDLSSLEEYRKGMTANYTITKVLTYDQYTNLYSNYYLPKYYELVSPTSTSTPATAPTPAQETPAPTLAPGTPISTSTPTPTPTLTPVPSPTPTPTLTPTATPTPTTTIPTSTTNPCLLKTKGDANCDGVIDILDFNIWLGEFKKTSNTTFTDFNNDGIIDTRDFNIWRDNYLQQL